MSTPFKRQPVFRLNLYCFFHGYEELLHNDEFTTRRVGKHNIYYVPPSTPLSPIVKTSTMLQKRNKFLNLQGMGNVTFPPARAMWQYV